MYINTAMGNKGHSGEVECESFLIFHVCSGIYPHSSRRINVVVGGSQVFKGLYFVLNNNKRAVDKTQ